MGNSLDALCRRFKISLAERSLHGALIDARLLAEVYLELKGGKERVLDLSTRSGTAATATAAFMASGGHAPRPRPLAPRSNPDERTAHREFLATMLKDQSLWAGYGLDMKKASAD